jgi:hypothetical protein
MTTWCRSGFTVAPTADIRQANNPHHRLDDHMKFITELRSRVDVVLPSAYEAALIRQPFRNDSPDPVNIYHGAEAVVLQPGEEALFEPREGGGWTINVRSGAP